MQASEARRNVYIRRLNAMLAHQASERSEFEKQFGVVGHIDREPGVR
jgi:hypothetical protein